MHEVCTTTRRNNYHNIEGIDFGKPISSCVRRLAKACKDYCFVLYICLLPSKEAFYVVVEASLAILVAPCLIDDTTSYCTRHCQTPLVTQHNKVIVPNLHQEN